MTRKPTITVDELLLRVAAREAARTTAGLDPVRVARDAQRREKGASRARRRQSARGANGPRKDDA